MTDIKNHVVSLEIAKQLKEAGWKKETEFDFVEHKSILSSGYEECRLLIPATSVSLYPEEYWNYYPAPLATEILEELPEKISLCAFYAKSEYRAVDNDVHRNASTQVSHNPCNALASMWLYLKKKKLI